MKGRFQAAAGKGAAFKWCSVGTKWPNVCQKKKKHTTIRVRPQSPFPLQQVRWYFQHFLTVYQNNTKQLLLESVFLHFCVLWKEILIFLLTADGRGRLQAPPSCDPDIFKVQRCVTECSFVPLCCAALLFINLTFLEARTRLVLCLWSLANDVFSACFCFTIIAKYFLMISAFRLWL